MIADAARLQELRLDARTIVVLAQKVVSKAEGRIVDLATVLPGDTARELAAATGKDPRLVELVLAESAAVLRYREGVLIVEHRGGTVIANAGIDRSNVEAGFGEEPVLLLPDDADRSAAAIRAALAAETGAAPGVIICDSVGRAWRNGTVGLAIGCAGIPALIDLRGRTDRNGRPLQVSEIAFADSVAAAACLVMGEAAEGTPVALVSGLAPDAPEQPASALVRPRHLDLFR